MKLHFHDPNGPADTAIADLIRMVGGIKSPELIREMIIAALKAGQEDDDKADLKLMNTTLKEMRFTGKIFGPYSHVKKVTVFGSARTKPDAAAYRMAVQLGRELKAAGYMVITGGGPGIMQAVNEGAGAEHSFGVNIRLPFEQKANPIIHGNPRSITYKYFFNRKVAFLKEAHAVALFPGGFGTLDEAMETLTLVQTGKRDLMPLILIDPPGSTYWYHWLEFLKTELMAPGYISPEDFSLFDRVESTAEAVRRIDHFYRQFHSLRYVDDKLVIRMNRSLTPAAFEKIRDTFGNILVPGGVIVLSEHLPEEENERDIIHLPRLVIDFSRQNFGRLRRLIDMMNDEMDGQS